MNNMLYGVEEFEFINLEMVLTRDLEKVKQALLKAQEQKNVLEIIKNKTDLSALIDAKNVDDFNWYLCCEDKEHEFTEEEFELLKAYFEKSIQK